MANDRFAMLRVEQARHCFFDLIEKLVNDRVKFDLHAFVFGRGYCHVFHFDVEADDDGVGRARQENVVFRNWPDSSVDYFEVDFLALDLIEGTGQCLK